MKDSREERAKEVPNTPGKLALERTYLSYERTMLSWVRTATSLITFGFSIQQFFRIATSATFQGKGLVGPEEFGLIMIVIGLLALLLAAVDHRAHINALRAQYPVKDGYNNLPPSQATFLAALIGMLGLLAFSSVLFGK
jgi:putative membrane protein